MFWAMVFSLFLLWLFCHIYCLQYKEMYLLKPMFNMKMCIFLNHVILESLMTLT